MSSFVLPWIEIKPDCESIGPGLGRPYRPERCQLCGHGGVWFNGWRLVLIVVLMRGGATRLLRDLPLQRVKCASCRRSWTMMPAFMSRRRVFAADVNEAAGLAYLSDPKASYRRVAALFGCSHSVVWMWVGWLAMLETPRVLVAEATRLDPMSPAVDQIPREVPEAHPKARSKRRARALLRTYQLLVALVCWMRARPVPTADPSPLRSRLVELFHAFPPVTLRGRPLDSPSIEQRIEGRGG
jgi:hypothetical protein